MHALPNLLLLLLPLVSSGSWCPYQVDKVVPCRVRNGTEPYLGPKICWKSMNGSFSCTKKVLYRPTFSTTYKTIQETKYKCCPGLQGEDCEQECFNCTTLRRLEKRVDLLEQERMRGLLENHVQLRNLFHHDETENELGLGERASSPLTASVIDARITNVVSELRSLESRLHSLESQLSRLHALILSFHQKDPAALMEKTAAASTAAGIRFLEENLERGDIASTLNDDYGEELFENSTEQYVDPLLVQEVK